MLCRRAIAAFVARAGHACNRATCRHCLAAVAFRGMATKPARLDKEPSFDVSRLETPVQREIEHQARLIKDEKLSIEHVIEEHGKLLREQNISVTSEDGQVKLVIPKEGYKYVVSFDAAEVADAVNGAPTEFDAEEEVEEEASEEFGEEDADDALQPFSINIAVERDGMAKRLNMQAEVSPSMEEEGAYELYVTDVTVEGKKDAEATYAEATYAGPSFETLDDAVREKFEEFANRNFTKLLPFIAEYARAKEANLYQEWLADVKAIVTKD